MLLAATGSVTFAAGQATVDVVVQAIPDGDVELPETITIDLNESTGEPPLWQLGSDASATIAIDDAPAVIDLELLHDTTIANDGITSDGTVRGTLVDDGFLSSYHSGTSTYVVEVDLNSDGTVDFVVTPTWVNSSTSGWIQAFEFNPIEERVSVSHRQPRGC